MPQRETGRHRRTIATPDLPSTAPTEESAAAEVGRRRHAARRQASRRAASALVAGAAVAVAGLVGVWDLAAGGAAPASAAGRAVLAAQGAAAATAPRPIDTRANRSAHRQPLLGLTTPPVAHRTPIARHLHAARTPSWVRPDVGVLSSRYGYRASMGDFHPGIDIAGPWGSPIRAAATGTVTFAGPATGFGQMITIQHAGGIRTVYGHMSRLLVKQGAHVHAGQIIAREGSEGHSTGPHLHFEVWVHGHRVDPLHFLATHGVHIPTS